MKILLFCWEIWEFSSNLRHIFDPFYPSSCKE